MSEIKSRIAEILHQHGWHEWREQCCCGWPGAQRSATDREVDDHIASVLVTELGLREERRTNEMSSAGVTSNWKTGDVTFHSDYRQDRRYVTAWEPA